MSFMFNPFDYDDQTAVNRPELSEWISRSVISGLSETAAFVSDLVTEDFKDKGVKSIVLCFDGYISAQLLPTINLVSQTLGSKSLNVTVIEFASVFKTREELDNLFSANLETDYAKDPVLLFGKLFHGTYAELFNPEKSEILKKKIGDLKSGNRSREVVIVYGCGSAYKTFRHLYDYVFYYDVTPKEVVLRAKNRLFTNLGDSVARPFNEMLRRCYYVDYEVAVKQRKELLENDAIDFYVASDNQLKINLIPRTSFNAIMSELVKYPLRCKPVYLEGVWGGHYFRKLRNLPAGMKNCAWVYDLIPLEVSIVVADGFNILEFPFFTFVQKEGINLMGEECMKRFKGYFPVRFNYDDTYHSSGNMSIQVHPGHDYNISNFGEPGGQDESYYIIATGHGARTFLGFREGADIDEFIKEVKRSEKDFIRVDYEKYINHEPSKPGVQFLIPAGTIHSSGRNQVVLETGSLTIGSYTFKLYDYLRADLDGVPRPIHTFHGERVIRKERNSSWVKKNLVKEPVLVRKGENFAEYIVGEHDLLYFSLRRIEFEHSVDDDTNGKFHVLNLVDGESVRIQSIANPELYYIQNFLDIIIVPANIGRYTIINLGNQPVCIHKTVLKEGFVNDRG